MDSEPNREPRRRTLAAVVTAGVALLLVIAVLATRLASEPGASAASPSPSASPTSTTLTVQAIYQRLLPSMVTVKDGTSLGTGVIVSDQGTIVTANHVIARGGAIAVTYADGTTVAATVDAANAATDIATLTPERLPQVVVPATLGGTPAVGDAVIAIGNPEGLTDSVTSGIVSGLNRSAATDDGKRSGMIQFDAAVNPGSSGGPLLDNHGKVVGIVIALATPDGQDAFSGIGFAVPIGSALNGNGGAGQPNGPQI